MVEVSEGVPNWVVEAIEVLVEVFAVELEELLRIKLEVEL